MAVMQRSPARRRLALGLVIAAALLGVFLLYADPQFIVLLSQQLWACF